jgi:hypothetical protein
MDFRLKFSHKSHANRELGSNMTVRIQDFFSFLKSMHVQHILLEDKK